MQDVDQIINEQNRVDTLSLAISFTRVLCARVPEMFGKLPGSMKSLDEDWSQF